MACLKRCPVFTGSESSKYSELPLSSLKEVIIGRDYDCDIRISNIEISRRHAKVARSGDTWTIMDLKSTNGIFINGKSLTPMVPHALKDNDLISFGPMEKSEFLYKFKRSNVQTEPSASNETARRTIPLAVCTNIKSSPNALRRREVSRRSKQSACLNDGQNAKADTEPGVSHIIQPTSSRASPDSSNHDHRYAAVKRESVELVSESDLQQAFASPKAQSKKKSKKSTTETNASETERLRQLETQMREKAKSEEKLKKKLKLQENKLKLQELVSLKREEKIQQLMQELQKQKKKTEEAEEKRKEEEEKRLKEEEEKRKLKQKEERQKKELQELKKKEEMAMKLCKEAKKKNVEEIPKPKGTVKVEPVACNDAAINEGASCSGTQVKRKYEDIFDSELTCSICHELFIQPMTLSCSHTFCAFCIELWKKKKASHRECPICRKPMTIMTRQLVIENLVDKIVNEMDEETKAHRKKITEERKNSTIKLTIPTTSTTTAPANDSGSFAEDLSDSSEMDNFWDSDSDSDSYNSSFFPTFFAWGNVSDAPDLDDEDDEDDDDNDFHDSYALHGVSDLDDSDDDVLLDNMEDSWGHDDSSLESFESANDLNDSFSESGEDTINFGDIMEVDGAEGDSSDYDVTETDAVENEL